MMILIIMIIIIFADDDEYRKIESIRTFKEFDGDYYKPMVVLQEEITIA